MLTNEWFIIHPAHSAPHKLKVVASEDLSPTATRDEKLVLCRRGPAKFKGNVLVNFNHLDYIMDGPFDTKKEAQKRMWDASAHNWVLWGSGSMDRETGDSRA